MALFAKATPPKSEAAGSVVRSSDVGPFILPFDGHRPVLVCGHTFSGKEAFVSHLIGQRKGNKTIHVLDPTARTNYVVPGSTVETLRPDNVESEGAFFTKASTVLADATAVEGGICVIDEFLLMTDPYQVPLPEQETFLYVLEEALQTARQNRARIFMVSTRIPPKQEMTKFGSRFFIGPILPMDWVMMFNRSAAEVETANRPGTGVLCLDGHFSAIEFPLSAPRAPAAAQGKRAFGRATKKAADNSHSSNGGQRRA